MIVGPLTETRRSPACCKQSDVHNVLRRPRVQSDVILRLIADPADPLWDNIAEPGVPRTRVNLKISGCFSTVTVADKFFIIRSVSTCYANKDTC